MNKLAIGLEPIGHIPPLPPIEIAPRVPVTRADDDDLSLIESVAVQAAEQERAEFAARAWKALCEIASGTNPPVQES